MTQGFTRSIISITGDSGGALQGSSFAITGGSTGLTFAGSGTTETLGGTLVRSNGGTGYSSSKPIVQVVYASSSSVDTTTTVMTYGSSIPTNTQGKEFLSATITPVSSSNILRIYGVLYLDTSVTNAVWGLFQDSTANAITAGTSYAPATVIVPTPYYYYMTARTTSSTTFKIRAGPRTAGTLYFNEDSLGNTLGGVLLSTLIVEEIQV